MQRCWLSLFSVYFYPWCCCYCHHSLRSCHHSLLLLILLLLLIVAWNVFPCWYQGTVMALSPKLPNLLDCHDPHICCCDSHIWSIIKNFRQFATEGAVTAPFAHPPARVVVAVSPMSWSLPPMLLSHRLIVVAPVATSLGGGPINLWQQHWHCRIMCHS